MAARGQERNQPHQAEEQGPGERPREENQRVSDHEEAAVHEHREELPLDQLYEEHAGLS